MNARELAELKQKIKELEKRVAQLEERKKPGPKRQNG